MLAEDGVDLSATARTPEPTTLALAEIDAGGQASYRFYAAGTAGLGLTTENALAALPAEVDVLHVGTLSLVYDPNASALEAVVEKMHACSPVAADPNHRPAAVRHERTYRSRPNRILRHTPPLNRSEDDRGWRAPRRPLLELGPSVVLLTRGSAGATVLSPGRETGVEAPRVDVVDTIGAGDAFGGGFLAWWHGRDLGRDDLADHELVVEATRFAVRVAAITCARAGASPPRLGDM